MNERQRWFRCSGESEECRYEGSVPAFDYDDARQVFLALHPGILPETVRVEPINDPGRGSGAA
jgi:hypothetical protein